MSEEEKKEPESPLEGYDEGVRDYLDKKALRRRYRPELGHSLVEDCETTISALSRLDARVAELEVLLTPLMINPAQERERWKPNPPDNISPVRRRLDEIRQHTDELTERIVVLIQSIDV